MQFDHTTEVITPLRTSGVTLGGQAGAILPTGNTAARPTHTTGTVRYNTTIGRFEYSTGAAWVTIQSPPTVDDTEPPSPVAGDWWLRPSDGVISMWVPLEGGGGTWFTPVAGIPNGYLQNTTDTFTGTLTMAGSIIPSVDIAYDLGSPTRMWRDLYVGPGSIYMNGKKILEDNSDTIVFSTDINQNVRMEASGTGNVEVMADAGGAIQLRGTVNLSAGKKIIASDGSKIEFGDDIDTGVNHILTTSTPTLGNHVTTKTYVDSVSVNDTTIVRTTGDQVVGGNKTFSGNFIVGGNLTVQGTTTTVNSETLSIADNVIELNSNFTSGSPTENSGILIRRGDLGTAQWIWDETNDRFTGITGAGTILDLNIGAVTATTINAGNVTFTGTVTGVSKAAVGLGNVDNTSDLNKPISTATQTALDDKVFGLNGAKYIGFEPSTDYTNPWMRSNDPGNPSTGAYLQVRIPTGSTSQYYRGDKTWQTLNSAAVGLNLVNNTADIDKTVYSALRLRHAGGAGNTAMIFNWQDPGGQPAYVWGGSDGVNMYVFNRSALSVNYANSTGTVNGASGGTIGSDLSIVGQTYSVNGFLWSGSARALRPNGGYAVNGPYRQNPIIDCSTGQGDISDFSSYHQPGVESFFQMNVGGSGNYFRFSNNGVGSSNAGWGTHSDRRVKEDIRRITNALETIRKVNGYTFIKPTERPYHSDVAPRRMGYIAQEWLDAAPEIVDVPHDYDKETNTGGILSVFDGSSTALLLEGIKELADQVDALRAENAELRAKVEKLE